MGGSDSVPPLDLGMYMDQPMRGWYLSRHCKNKLSASTKFGGSLYCCTLEISAAFKALFCSVVLIQIISTTITGGNSLTYITETCLPKNSG